jgi:hypothetical protein
MSRSSTRKNTLLDDNNENPRSIRERPVQPSPHYASGLFHTEIVTVHKQGPAARQDQIEGLWTEVKAL